MDDPGVEVLVSCVGVRSTGKRHNSMFFTFRIEQNIRGELGQDEYTSQEIFWDFGAGQIVEKLGMKFDSSATGIGKGMTTASCAHRGVLKLVPDPERGGQDASTGWRILWAAREGEADAARALERVARALISAVESKDLEPVRSHLAPNSNVTRDEILAVAREEGRFEPGDFARKTYWALLGERRGVVYVGGGGAYTIQIIRDPAGRWTIARIEWR